LPYVSPGIFVFWVYPMGYTVSEAVQYYIGNTETQRYGRLEIDRCGQQIVGDSPAANLNQHFLSTWGLPDMADMIVVSLASSAFKLAIHIATGGV
jgi:hypothetical protein